MPALTGNLDNVDYKAHPIFGMMIPQTCPDVPSNMLNPDDTWKNQDQYNTTASLLAHKFEENYKQCSVLT